MKRNPMKKKSLSWLWYSCLVWAGFALGWVMRRRRMHQAHPAAELAGTADQEAALYALRAARDDALHVTSKLAAKETELAQLTHAHGLKIGETEMLTTRTATTMAAMNGKDNEIAALTARVSELEAVLARRAELADQLINKQAELARLSADWAVRLKAKDEAFNAQKAELDRTKSRANVTTGAPLVNVDWRAQLAGKDNELAQAKQQHSRALAELTVAATASTTSAVRAKDDEIGALKIQINQLSAALQTRDSELVRLKADQGKKDASLKSHQDDLSAALIRIGELEAVMATLRAGRVEPKSATVPSTPPKPAMSIQSALNAGLAVDVAARDVAGHIDSDSLSPIPAGVEAEPDPTVFKLSKSFVDEAAQQAGVDIVPSGCPQDLSEIAGIGSVFEQRLHDYGIGTYWEVSHASDEVLRAALKLDEASRKGRSGNRVLQVDFEAIRADALRLANTTQTQGRTWTGGQADDFEPIAGIGPVLEQRLFNAGICTYEVLAKTSEAKLAEICNSSKRVKTPDYASWIAQAQALAGAKATAK